MTAARFGFAKGLGGTGTGRQTKSQGAGQRARGPEERRDWRRRGGRKIWSQRSKEGKTADKKSEGCGSGPIRERRGRSEAWERLGRRGRGGPRRQRERMYVFIDLLCFILYNTYTYNLIDFMISFTS